MVAWSRAFFVGAAAAASALKFQDVRPLYPLGETTRECHVHSCESTPAETAFAAQKCDKRKGHMGPMGAQQEMAEVPRVSVSEGAAFYEGYVSGAQPVILAGAARDATGGVEWDDAFLESVCAMEDGQAWRALIEVNKVIVTNTRWPLMDNWTFCDFVRNYTKPEYDDKLYVVTPLTDPGVQLGQHVKVPEVLRCSELYEAVHDTRLWMSGGNTSSSLHFDTHENLMLQIDGSKAVYFWPASQSHLLYMDYHNRFGLSPVHPDRVDLDRYPMFAHAKGGMVAHLHKGDALLIPDGWWHQVRTLPGRNIAVAFEFEPYEGLTALWPGGDAVVKDYLRQKWSAQTRLKYRMKSFVTKRGGAIACNTTVDASRTAAGFRCYP